MKYFIFLVAVLLVYEGHSERLHEQIYSSIEGGAACFRRLNGTHQAGCASTDKGAVGVVEMVHDINDVNWLVQNASSGPYMAVISTLVFNSVIDAVLQKPDNIAGILLYENATETINAFSQESRCPNEYSSSEGNQCSSAAKGGNVWNEMGTGLLRRDIPFPIFFLPNARIDDVIKIRQCFERYNMNKDQQKGKPLCSLQLNSFMFAAVSSVLCLRRSAASLLTPTKVCDPLGDHNVYYSLFPRAQETESTKKPVILVTARIDTASLFDGLSPGAASSVVGMVTLITAAASLAKMIPIKDAQLYKKNVLWTLFNGESFDYIGSQRVAYDITRGVWPPVSPLSPKEIDLHIELGQIGGALAMFKDNATWPLRAFAPYTAPLPDMVSNFLNVLSSNSHQGMPVTPEFTTNLPPSSLHSFRRILKNFTETNELLEILLVDHSETFTNMYYESVLDDYDKIGFKYHNISIGSDGEFIPTDQLLANGNMSESEPQVKISRLADALSRTLYQQVTGVSYAGNISTSAHLVDEMLFCFLRSQACRLLVAADYANSGGEEALPDRPAPLYVGVAAWSGTPAVFAGHLLALLTGQQLAVNRTGCDVLSDSNYSHFWLRGFNHSGVCIQTTMNFSQAVSPAFVVPDYDLTSGEYSTWTESVWQTMWARVFVTSGGGGARTAAIAGAVATLVSLFLTFWLKRHAAVVFSDTPVVRDAATGILRSVNC